jgi:adenine/guanine phosphoribosyltransferase-like PRPP-binding protein
MVPEDVPSDFQSSLPLAPLLAEKYNVPLMFARKSG